MADCGPPRETILEHLAYGEPVVLCGSMSEYRLDEPFPLRNYTKLRAVNGSMNGFFVYNFEAEFDTMSDQLAEWIPVQNVVDGFTSLTAALAGLYEASNIGIKVCRVRVEPSECLPYLSS